MAGLTDSDVSTALTVGAAVLSGLAGWSVRAFGLGRAFERVMVKHRVEQASMLRWAAHRKPGHHIQLSMLAPTGTNSLIGASFTWAEIELECE